MLGTRINYPPIFWGSPTILPSARPRIRNHHGFPRGEPRKPSTVLLHRTCRRQPSRMTPGVPRRNRDSPDNHTCASGSSAHARRSTQTKSRNSRHPSGSARPERKCNPPRAHRTRIVLAAGWRSATQQRRSATTAEVTASVPLLSDPAPKDSKIRPSRALARDEVHRLSGAVDAQGRSARNRSEAVGVEGSGRRRPTSGLRRRGSH